MDERIDLITSLGIDVPTLALELSKAQIFVEEGNAAEATQIVNGMIKEAKHEDYQMRDSIYMACANLLWRFNERKARKIQRKVQTSPLEPITYQGKLVATGFCGFTYRQSGKEIDILYIIGLTPLPSLPRKTFIEAVFQNPADKDNPLLVEEPIDRDEIDKKFWRVIALRSPPVSGLTAGTRYEVILTVWADESKTEKLEIIHQHVLCPCTRGRLKESNLTRVLPRDVPLL